MSDLNKQTSAPQGDLGFVQLIAMIIGSTIGAGIFTTIGDMAANGAFSGAVLIGWGIAGIGMLALSLCFFGLNKVRPDLTNGVYSYAKEGFGEYVGFNSAWGYWLSALLCNVSYTTLLFGSIGYFLPIFGAGNNLLSVVCASVVIWILNFLVLRGVKEAAGLNIITTIAKLVPLAVFLVSIVFIGAFDFDIFKHNFWGDGSMSLLDQIKGTTGATVWSFIGVEGAVVLSARAKKSSDVGKASVMGFLGLLTIYVLVAVLSLGVMPAEEIAKLDNPQLAGILEAAVGPWGATLVNLGVILSLAGALLGWTIIAADCPYSAAKQGVFMKAFARDNKHGSPVYYKWYHSGVPDYRILQCINIPAVLQSVSFHDYDSIPFQCLILRKGDIQKRRNACRIHCRCADKRTYFCYSWFHIWCVDALFRRFKLPSCHNNSIFIGINCIRSRKKRTWRTDFQGT